MIKQGWGNKQPGLQKDKNWLIQKYEIEKLSAREIANLCNLKSQDAIYRWMRKFGIIRRTYSEAARGKNNYMRGKTHSQRVKKIISETHKGQIFSDEWKKEHSKKMKEWHKHNLHPLLGKKLTKEEIKRSLKLTSKRPTIPEKAFDEITPEIVRYVGNGAWWRLLPNGKYKNPDFKVTRMDKVIEIFGGKDYFHTEKEAEELPLLYEQIGLKCLIFWEDEVYKQPDMVLEKTIDFISN